jgi:hypothetical protein
MKLQNTTTHAYVFGFGPPDGTVCKILKNPDYGNEMEGL